MHFGRHANGGGGYSPPPPPGYVTGKNYEAFCMTEIFQQPFSTACIAYLSRQLSFM